MEVADPCFEVGVEVLAGEVHDGAVLSHDAVSSFLLLFRSGYKRQPSEKEDV